jgi:hypothetical protein
MTVKSVARLIAVRTLFGIAAPPSTLSLFLGAMTDMNIAAESQRYALAD